MGSDPGRASVCHALDVARTTLPLYEIPKPSAMPGPGQGSFASIRGNCQRQKCPLEWIAGDCGKSGRFSVCLSPSGHAANRPPGSKKTRGTCTVHVPRKFQQVPTPRLFPDQLQRRGQRRQKRLCRIRRIAGHVRNHIAGGSRAASRHRGAFPRNVKVTDGDRRWFETKLRQIQFAIPLRFARRCRLALFHGNEWRRGNLQRFRGTGTKGIERWGFRTVIRVGTSRLLKTLLVIVSRIVGFVRVHFFQGLGIHRRLGTLECGCGRGGTVRRLGSRGSRRGDIGSTIPGRAVARAAGTATKGSVTAATRTRIATRERNVRTVIRCVSHPIITGIAA